MPASRTENISNNETKTNSQPFTLFLVAAVAGLLIMLPLLPAWVTNVTYSFSGQSPKIYWYLSRAAGFAALTILWVAMALGLSISNKMARMWPGAPAAFAIHEYVSLLGLAFAMYHALVLMGDHFVDFSLPRLLSPFSIAYETFWVGLGQLCFYAWLVVVLSFYVRKSIGPRIWRAIHYVNFATYLMGISHGIFSGTDSTQPWVSWYYALSVSSLLVLVVYRVYVAKLQNSLPGIKQNPWSMVQHFSLTVVYRVAPGILTIAKKAPRAFLSENSPLLLNLAAVAGNTPEAPSQGSLPAASSVPDMPALQPALSSIPVADLSAPEDQPENLPETALPVSSLPAVSVDQPVPEAVMSESLTQEQVGLTPPAPLPPVEAMKPALRPRQAPQSFDPIELELQAARGQANRESAITPVQPVREHEIKRELEKAPILRSQVERLRQSNLT